MSGDNNIRHTLENKERGAAGAADSPDGPPPADDGNGNDQQALPPADPIARRVFERIGASRFGVWFRGARFEDGEIVTVAVDNLFLVDYLREHFMADLQAASEGHPVRICVSGTKAQAPTGTSAEAEADLANPAEDPDVCLLAAAFLEG